MPEKELRRVLSCEQQWAQKKEMNWSHWRRIWTGTSEKLNTNASHGTKECKYIEFKYKLIAFLAPAKDPQINDLNLGTFKNDTAWLINWTQSAE